MNLTPHTKKTEAFGTCAVDKEYPLDTSTINGATKFLTCQLTLEEASKLKQAIDECIRDIFAYKQITTVAKRARMEIAIHRDTMPMRISVHKYPKRSE